jgi:hypothetical protein
MKIDKHISELLYEYDCVIVPEFGGFVANYASAKIHPTQHTFTPPSKNIVFNKNLKNNDGLLANHIASIEKISYAEAIKFINIFASNVNAQLKKGEKVALDEIGSLYLDLERNIQFEHGNVNYLLDAYGLNHFHSPQIKRDNIGKRLEKEFKDRAAIPAEKKKINIKRYVALAILIPFIFGLIWIPLKTDLLKNINNSGINPFSSKDISKNSVAENVTVNAPKMETAETKPISNSNDTSNYIQFYFKDSTAQPITTIDKIESKTSGIVKADSTSVAVNNMNSDLYLKFHLVTGCFQIHDNADKFVQDLKNQHITASIIGKRNGLYVVSAGEYATRKEAFIQLMQLKKNQPDAWLLKKEF